MPDDFERGLREWGGRPAPTETGAAATGVVAKLAHRSPSPMRPRLIAAAAVVVVALVGGAWFSMRGTAAGSDVPVPPLGDDVVLWWVDPETPVYFVLTPPNKSD